MSCVDGRSCLSSIFKCPLETEVLFEKRKSTCNLMLSNTHFFKMARLSCKLSDNETRGNPSSTEVSFRSKTNRMEEYNIAMKKIMRNPYEYHHDLGMNYTLITDNLIVGSQPQKPEDIDHLKKEENVAYILNLQQDKDIEYWEIDFQPIVKRCQAIGIRHMRRPLNTAYDTLTSKRPCGPNKKAIRGATYDLAKNDPWKEPFENLPEYAFEDIADWERKLIQECVRSLRGT
ncbi:phosphoglucan phosphatase LSF2, chloroplastic-like isoform X2 [Pistacia vera]|uniref:phosphoglucan phosphatase LSF2, chloroplastic-like isoform X2 n=1 Tax=Pistacia vera TaxID=55513 RepID=UPI0012630F64|nr:phosphoglucan phosphatase LSF2, chloroplastic-like isoform X2 [Pistacia vera]